MKLFPQACKAAFTLVEVLAVLTTIAIFSSVGYVAVSNTQKAASAGKLEQDVVILNNAIDLYVVSGGDFSGVTTASEAVAKLKTRATDADVAITLGTSGSFIDPQIFPVPQNAAEAISDTPRVYFDSSISPPRFYIARSGDSGGIKEFKLDPSGVPIDPPQEHRPPLLAQNAESGWIWANRRSSPPTSSPPQNPGVSDDGIPPGGSPTPVDPTPVDPTPKTPLFPPLINPPIRQWPSKNYPLSIELVNPNPSGSSEILYSVKNLDGTWSPYVIYTGAFPMDATEIQAYCESLKLDRYTDSGRESAIFTVLAHQDLPPGVLVAVAEIGNSGTLRGNVTIAERSPQGNINISGAASIQGNLFVPGTPAIYYRNVSAANLWSSATDSDFSGFIKGNKYDDQGKKVTPNPPGWSPSPRVIDLDGDIEPSNYYILLSGSATIDGKIFRRATPPTLPTVAPPPNKDNNKNRSFGWANVVTIDPTAPSNNEAGNLTISSNAEVTLKPGNYGKVSVQNTAILTLGDALNPENIQYYSFESLEAIGASSIKIVGKVVITINYDKGGKAFQTANSASMGNVDHPEYLQLNVYSSAAPNENVDHVIVSGAGNFYGQINAPKGRVQVGNSGSFRGSVTGYKMQMTGAGGGNVEFNLPPIAD